MSNVFRFAIIGAGNIASKFVHAVEMTEDCTICAVASKRRERARGFAQAHGIPQAYDSYARMLEAEHPDCVYIATTCDSHFELSMLCLEHRVPVVCEKAMFVNSNEAQTFFSNAKARGVFSMEALWSLFLPAIANARAWIAEGRIGKLVLAEFGIGFAAPRDMKKRYFNPALGGGAANDLSVYGFHILPYVTGREIEKAYADVVPAPTGVDETETVHLHLSGNLPAVVKSSLATRIEERMVIYGTQGRIVVPDSHFASESLLYDGEGALVERFEDGTTKNGFVYEIAEAMRCVREGQIESAIVPHSSTLRSARLIDLVRNSM